MKHKNCYFKKARVLAGIVIITTAALLPVKAYSLIKTNHYNQATEKQADIKLSSLSISKDTYSDTQWYIENPGYYMDYSFGFKLKQECITGMDMNITKAWKSMAKSKKDKHEVVVAVIDTGVDYSHEDLADHMWVNKGEIPNDKIDNDKNGYVDDVYGWDFYNDDASTCHYDYIDKKKVASTKDNDNHGTHIAGIIAATADNNKGIAGVASNIKVKIMTLKINGGKNAEGRMSDAIEAVKYATMMGADICNLSWGTPEYSQGLYDTMKESNMLFVAAAGNKGINNDAVAMYPANFKLANLISVTAIDSDGELTAYSNFGADSVDIAAPGNSIYSTIIGGYGSKSGSSMAVPQVTSVAALLYSLSDHINAANVKDIIIHNLKELPELKGKIRYPGIVDAFKVISAEKDLNKDNIAPEITFKTTYNKKDINVNLTVKDLGKSNIRVIKWANGKKTTKDFKRGTKGTLVENNKVNLKTPGNYTFYASDYAGNETVVVYKVIDDRTAPKLTVSYSISDNYRDRTVSVKASDSQSGLNHVEYMPGVKKTADFISAKDATQITQKGGVGTFKVKEDGTFTIFASDNKGNTTVKVIKIKTIKATQLKFSNAPKTMSVGDVYYLKTNVQPANSTDKITYISSNTKVAEVTYSGKVIAFAEGTTKITVISSSGFKAECFITVKSDA